jgi:methylisocitrate lyase
MSIIAHPGTTLRKAMNQGVVAVPGAFNALVARAVADAGFHATYVSGGATANVAGYPDIGLITLTEMCRTISEIALASGLPVIADADTGYGELETSSRTIQEYERAGAAGLHIEDQVFPKRCGHLDGKQLIECDTMCLKIGAMARARVDPDFLIIARTDARGVTSMDDAIERANAYRAAGADMIFPEGLRDEQEFDRFAEGSPGLLLANMTEFGKTAIISLDRFGALGYSMVIYPLSMMRVAMGAVVPALKALKENGCVSTSLESMHTRQELYSLLGYVPGDDWHFPSSSR